MEGVPALGRIAFALDPRWLHHKIKLPVVAFHATACFSIGSRVVACMWMLDGTRRSIEVGGQPASVVVIYCSVFKRQRRTAPQIFYITPPNKLKLKLVLFSSDNFAWANIHASI
jgi:hypothetical protein